MPLKGVGVHVDTGLEGRPANSNGLRDAQRRGGGPALGLERPQMRGGGAASHDDSDGERAEQEPLHLVFLIVRKVRGSP